MFTRKTVVIIAVFVISMAASAIAAAQSPKKFEYKGVSIGMPADTVRTKLGNPKDKSDAQDMYSFSDTETAQFYYDASHQVHAIMITFMGDLKTAPSAKDVFGEDVAPKADGGISKLEKYQKEGFWISYNRTPGADAIVSIAVQKM